jgi:hypothetical protein
MPANDRTWHFQDPASKDRVLTVLQVEMDSMFDLVAVLEFDPATLVLTGYARMNGGTALGDQELAGAFRGLFFPI